MDQGEDDAEDKNVSSFIDVTDVRVFNRLCWWTAQYARTPYPRGWCTWGGDRSFGGGGIGRKCCGWGSDRRPRWAYRRFPYWGQPAGQFLCKTELSFQIQLSGAGI